MAETKNMAVGKFSDLMRDEFLELDDQGYSDRDILYALKQKYSKVPARSTVRGWRVTNRRESPLSQEDKDKLQELMQDSLNIVEDFSDDILDALVPDLMDRLEKGEHKKVSFDRAQDSVRKFLADKAKRADAALRRQGFADADPHTHPFIVAVMNQPSEPPIPGDSNGNSRTGSTFIIDAKAGDVQQVAGIQAVELPAPVGDAD